MAQLVSNVQQAPTMGKSLTSNKSVETHHDPGQPELEVKAADNPLKTPLQSSKTLPRCPDYKPTALRWWFHGLLIVCLALLLGMIEYAMRTLLANNQEDLISQLWLKNIEDHNGDHKQSPYNQRLVAVPSNTTSSQTEAYSANAGDLITPVYSSSTLETTTGSISPVHLDSHTPLSTWSSSPFFEYTGGSSFAPVSTSSTASGPSPLITTLSPYPDFTCITIISPKPTVSCIGTTFKTTPTTITVPSSEFLNIGTTTYTLSESTSTTSSTFPTSSVPYTSSDAFLHDGHTTSTITTIQTPTPSATDGGSLHLSVTTSAMAEVIEPVSPSATIPEADIVSDNTIRPNGEPVITVSEQTEVWEPRETTIEISLTDSVGNVGVERIKTTYPGGTSVYQATKTLPSEVHGASETVISQTEAWPSSKATLERTTTDSSGHVFVQTIITEVPAGTSVLESTLKVRPGESLVAVPKMIATTRGGLTEVMQTTFVDSEGRTITSSYTAVLGGESALATQTFFVATSVPPGYSVITVPTAVPTTEGGTIEVVPTVFTDAQGHLTTSFYTRTVNGTPTTRTMPVVLATPVSPGEKLVTLSTIMPTTVGGTTSVIETTSTDSLGRPTTFSYTTVEGGTLASTTVWTVVPTSTSTTPTNSNGTQDTGNAAVVVYGIGLRDYILGAFLPTVLAALIAYPFKLININARLMQPFHEMATAREADGVSAEASIFLRFYDWTGAFSLPRSVRLKQPVIVISDFLVLGAALLAPIAAETVSVHVPDGCQKGCFGNLGVTKIPGRVLEALMAAMMALLIALIVFLSVLRWETGVSHNPWSIAGMASLSLSPDISEKIRKISCHSIGPIKENIILKALTGSRYALDEYWVSSCPGAVSTRGYGIVVRTSDDDAKKLKSNEPKNGETSSSRCSKKGRETQPFALLTWWGRCVLLFILASVMIIATYYETTSLNSGFERFMNGRGFGVRFFFTALGVVIGGCMETFFRSVATILPFQQLSRCALPAERSILLSPPTNAFYGLYSAFRQRSIFFGSVAFATILAELVLPVTLSHVPFSHLDTYETQLVCAWLSISILSLMILVILCSFLIRWPHMPVDPRTIAGAMFYVCDSWMLGTMEGMATLGKKERDSIIRAQRLRYEFANSVGVSGKWRMNVDVCGETEEAAVMIRGGKARYG